MSEITTVIITKCDSVMKVGDYFQYPGDPFIEPEGYNDDDLDEDSR